MLNNFLGRKNIKVFFISLSLVFLMVLIPSFGLKVPSMVSPVASKDYVWDEIEAKLKQKVENYQLKRQFVPSVLAGSDYDQAAAYVVTDFDTGEILASKSLSRKLPMASLTKVMSAMVALDLAALDEEFIVSEKSSLQIPTKVMLKTGEKYTLKELLYSSLISSANDSTQVIKEGIDKKFRRDLHKGEQEFFIRAMNAKARILGLKNTHFTNPQGFDNQAHYSTVEDLAILSYHAIKQYPVISKIVASEVLDLTKNKTDMRFYLQNWNGLMGVYPGVSGIKIGNTEMAGLCTIVLSERENKKVLVVVLGAPGVLERDFWASQLLDLGFTQKGLRAINVTEQQLKEKYASWMYF